MGSTGAAYCWGQGVNGELGNGLASNSTVPVAVSMSGALAGQTLTQVSLGTNFACAMSAAGVTYCWGLGASGQLGNNATGTSTVAATVAPQGPAGVTALAGDTTAAVSWAAPAFLNGGSITGYTAAAAPGGTSCSTGGTTACTITGLADGTSYSVTVTVTVSTAAGTTLTAPSSPVTVEPLGFLSISVPAAATLPPAAPGGTAGGQLGTVTVTDNRALAAASWNATVTGTAFTSVGGTGRQTIAVTNVSYWSGPATKTSGGGTFVPGQPTAASAQVLVTPLTAFSLTGGSGVNTASWNPTLSVAVPLTAVAGTYTATVTHSVS